VKAGGRAVRGGQGGRGGERGVPGGQANGAGRGRVAQAVVEGLADGGEAAAAPLVEVGAGQQGVPAGDTAAAGAGHCRGWGGSRRAGVNHHTVTQQYATFYVPHVTPCRCQL